MIATCSHTKEQMLVQAKILKENLHLLDMAIEKTMESVPQEERHEVLTEALDCSRYISTNEELINHMIEDPLRPVVRKSREGLEIVDGISSDSGPVQWNIVPTTPRQLSHGGGETEDQFTSADDEVNQDSYHQVS